MGVPVRYLIWPVAGIMALPLAASTACGGDSKTPASTVTAVTTTAATSSPTAASSPTPVSDAGGAATLTLVAKNSVFDKSELKAKAGEVTIEVDNQDDGIPHNLHVYRGKDNTGEDLGKTEMEAGPVKQTLKLNLTPGEYFFVCDVHPATMSGKIEVE